MSEQVAEQLVHASPYRVRSVLLDPGRLPSWNPAIRTVNGPWEVRIGVGYQITAIGGLSGLLTYTAIDTGRIETRMSVQGMTEDGWWEFRDDDGRTRVRHGFRHRGLLALLLAGAFRGVAGMRLGRLAVQV